jgi:hypothetical protein
MKIIKIYALLLCLISPFAHAETTLFGLTLGKTTVSELQQRYNTTQHTSASYPDGWVQYIVSASEIPALKAIAKDVSFPFINESRLGGVWITYPRSEATFELLKQELDQKYPSVPAGYTITGGLVANYKNSEVDISLIYDEYGTTLLYTDMNYRRLLKEANEQRKRDFQANKLKKEP